MLLQLKCYFSLFGIFCLCFCAGFCEGKVLVTIMLLTHVIFNVGFVLFNTFRATAVLSLFLFDN